MDTIQCGLILYDGTHFRSWLVISSFFIFYLPSVNRYIVVDIRLRKYKKTNMSQHLIISPASEQTFRSEILGSSSMWTMTRLYSLLSFNYHNWAKGSHTHTLIYWMNLFIGPRFNPAGLESGFAENKLDHIDQILTNGDIQGLLITQKDRHKKCLCQKMKPGVRATWFLI